MLPVVTALYGAVNALLNIVLATIVVVARGRHKVSLGHGEHPAMLVAIRAHANNAEFVPLAIVMLLLVELCGGDRVLLHVLGGTLTIARIAHAVGLPRPSPNVFRLAGVTLTWAMIVACAGYALYLR